MKPMHFAMALLSAAMFFVLAGVFMGVQLELDGTKLVVDTAADIRWQWVFAGTAVVFLFQLRASIAGPATCGEGVTILSSGTSLSFSATLVAVNSRI
jgi:hypothetical protein